MSANVETMFYVNSDGRGTPWHGLGQEVKEALNSQQALIAAGLDWRVIQKPLYINTGDGFIQVKDQFANVRETDNLFLGNVSDKYKIVQNEDAFSFTDNLLGEGVTYETAGSLSNGKKVWMLARMPETELVGDKTIPYLVFTNSFDGKGSIRVAITPVRVVCQNTLNLALSQAVRAWSTKHVGNIEGKLEEAKKTLELASVYMKNLQKSAVELAKDVISHIDFKVFTETLLPITDDMLGNTKAQEVVEEDRRLLTKAYFEAPDIEQFVGTKWGVINAVSDMATHTQPKRFTVTGQENRFMTTIEGNKLIDKAYELLATF
jgi:phage/plasmid-like protein (TIGR03299 family)